MSNTLHHVAPASFFPTTKELSSGLQWFKEHPILAAAAATAVSVITYLNTADVDADAAYSMASSLSGKEDELHPDEDENDVADATLEGSRSARKGRMCGARTLATVAASPQGLATPPALRKHGASSSEGKISSPAAVSWVDEHGGSLTQVFEHLTTVDDPEYPDLDGPSPRPRPSGGRPPTPRRHSARDDRACIRSDSADHASDPAALGADRQTESPQWGWYVPITPPQDHLSVHTALPRAMAQPPPAASAAMGMAMGMGVGLDRSALAGGADGAALRRSASGRIKT